MQALKEWFEALWGDSADITQDFLTELNRSWPLAETPPYHVYLKALYELYGDEVTGALPAPPPPREPKLAITRSNKSYNQATVRVIVGQTEDR